jgi:hypothetical protein
MKRQQHDDNKHAKRKNMNTQRMLIKLQYNIRNNKKDIMIFLLINSIVSKVIVELS